MLAARFAAPVLLLGLIAPLCGCPAPQGGGAVVKTKDPKMPNMKPGPTIDVSKAGAAAELRAFFEANQKTAAGQRRLFRVPVALRFEDPSRLAIAAAFVGAHLPAAGQDALALQLDDSALGVSLLEQVGRACPKDRTECAVWLTGHWGALVGGPELPESGEPGPKRWPFAVVRVGDAVDASAPAAVYVQE